MNLADAVSALARQAVADVTNAVVEASAAKPDTAVMVSMAMVPIAALDTYVRRHSEEG